MFSLLNGLIPTTSPPKLKSETKEFEECLKNLSSTNPQVLVQEIRKIAETVVHAEQNHIQAILDLFFERCIVGELKEICLRSNGEEDYEVQIQILQTLSILAQCLKNETNLFQFLSQNHINTIISHEFPFDSAPEELLAHYITLLKTLSLRFNKDLCQFFFDSRKLPLKFPMYDKAVELFSNKEPLVRAASRSIILLISSVNDEEIQLYISSRIDLFEMMCTYIKSKLDIISNLVLESSVITLTIDSNWYHKIETNAIDGLDDFTFLHDMLNLRRIEQEGKTFREVVLRVILQPLKEKYDNENSCTALFSLAQCSLVMNSQQNKLIQNLFELFIMKKEDNCLQIFDEKINSKDERIAIAGLTLTYCFVDKVSSLEFTSRKQLETDRLEKGISQQTEQNQLISQKQQVEEEEDIEEIIDNSNTVEEPSLKEDEETVNSPDPLLGSTTNAIHIQPKPLPVTPAAANQVNKNLEKSKKSSSAKKKKKKSSSLDLTRSPEKSTVVKEKEDQQKEIPPRYSQEIVEMLLKTMIKRTSQESRPVTVRLIAKILVQLTFDSRLLDLHEVFLNSKHSALLKMSISNSAKKLYKDLESTDISVFVELFENEWKDLKAGPLKVVSLVTSASSLLPNPETLVEEEEKEEEGKKNRVLLENLLFDRVPLSNRLPLQRVEEVRSHSQIFMILRLCWASLQQEPDLFLPSVGGIDVDSIREESAIDLRKCEFLEVTIVSKPSHPTTVTSSTKLLLVLVTGAMILVEPDDHRRATGICRLVAPVHRVEVGSDMKDASILNCLIRSHRRIGLSQKVGNKSEYSLSIKFDGEARAIFARDQIERACRRGLQDKYIRIKTVLEELIIKE